MGLEESVDVGEVGGAKEASRCTLKDDVYEVAVVDVRAHVSSNLGMNFGHSAFDADRGRVATVTFGERPRLHPCAASLLPPTIWHHHFI